MPGSKRSKLHNLNVPHSDLSKYSFQPVTVTKSKRRHIKTVWNGTVVLERAKWYLAMKSADMKVVSHTQVSEK